MTATKTAPPPSTYVSGHCGSGRHDACRGAYAGTDCTCACEHWPAEPEPEPEPVELEQPPPAPAPPPTRHCLTCTCGDPQ